MLKELRDLVREIRREPWTRDICADEDFWSHLMDWIQEQVLAGFIDSLVGQIDEIVDIDPDLPEPQILERAIRYMVEFLGAHSASVRIYDPRTGQMLSYGSYPSKEDDREALIPLDESIAGEVVRTRVPYLAADLSKEPLYSNKDALGEKAFQSLMAIPFEIQRFSPRDRDTVGVIQIYYPDKNRPFGRLEVRAADTMAKRLSFVIARKKILSMYRMDEKKEMIVRQIFRKLGSRGGVKLTEVFNRVVPELAEMVNLQSCTLFSVTKDLDRVILQAGFPRDGYHSVGRVFAVSSEPVFELLLNLREYTGDSAYEVVTPSYISVVDPRRSSIISESLKRFAALHNINSILYLPLGYDGETTHFLAIDAVEQRQRYSSDEVEIFLFLGRELMKAQKMERLDDALHDFKNPAIAIAGFARRLKEILRKDQLDQSKEQVVKYVDILLHETSRLQELAMSIYMVGDEQPVNLTEVLKKRFEINREAIKEQLRQNVILEEGPFDPDITVMCHAVHMERVFDNLLNNATKAIPLAGGKLAIRTRREGEWACAEISNTGEISEHNRMKILEGEGEGRGLYITYRIMRLLKGKIDIRTGDGSTTFVVCFPVYQPNPRRCGEES